MSGFWRLRLHGADAAESDRVIAECWSLGALGCVELEDDGGLEVYFAETDAAAAHELQAAADSWGATSSPIEALADEDWLASYRALARVEQIGSLRIDPREPDLVDSDLVEERSSGATIRVPARRAFGTGSHPTTRMMLGALEEAEVAGRTVLDVGCGTGVLSFAALLFGARWAVALDVDPDAAAAVVENRRLNGAEPRVFAGTVEAIAPSARFDRVLVNVLPDRVRGQEAAIARCCEPDGRLLLSGLPSEQVDDWLPAWLAAGLRPRSRLDSEGWACLTLCAREVDAAAGAAPSR